jgi:hypothetical protein
MSMTLGEDVCPIVNKWHYFSKETFKIQVVKSVYSIAANLS